MGEPAGIGPDITIAAWRRLANEPIRFFLVGDADVIAQRAGEMGAQCPVARISSPHEADDLFPAALPILHAAVQGPVVSGTLNGDNSAAVLSSIRTAVDFAEAGDIAGVVTNPIHKSVLYGSGFSFQGHTDYLAELARQKGHDALPVMMLVSGNLRTVPLTIHIALKDVPAALTHDVIVDQTRIIERDLQRYFGIARPRIAMAGLNPHAGEDGTMGLEERHVIEPAIKLLSDGGMNVTGPLPADTIFHDEARANFDVIVCMYHDQALIPVKSIDFHNAVNITLGLPFVRTSPDHGTALSLAGTGKANPASLMAAIRLAAEMANQAKSAT